MKPKLMYGISVIAGISFWIILTNITGLSEAWDDPIYFKAGIPVLIFINFIFGIIEPSKPWRWGLTSNVSQVIPMVIMSGSGSLLPLGVLLLMVLSIPSILASYFGSFLRNHFG